MAIVKLNPTWKKLSSVQIDQYDKKGDAHHFLTGVMTMQINLSWLIVGLLPYYIKRDKTKDRQILTVKALFWLVTIHWEKEQYLWEVSIPLVKSLRQR
jgi:hypothetical protein